MWTAQYYPFKRPRQLLTSGGLGTMGFGLPTAIGAALASPYRVDLIKIAEGFGLKTFNLTKEDDPVHILGKAFDQKGPCLIHVPIDPTERVYPMVPPGSANIEMIGGEYDIAN
jgi:thiamine pyrophosphate-dependent acetolactate synthase large subunit-like protein